MWLRGRWGGRAGGATESHAYFGTSSARKNAALWRSRRTAETGPTQERWGRRGGSGPRGGRGSFEYGSGEVGPAVSPASGFEAASRLALSRFFGGTSCALAIPPGHWASDSGRMPDVRSGPPSPTRLQPDGVLEFLACSPRRGRFPAMAPSYVCKYMDVVSALRKHLVAAKLYIWDELPRENGPRVSWQLRDFVLCLGYTGKFYLHDWLKATRAKRAALCTFFGLHQSDLVPSRRSLMTRGHQRGSGFELSGWTIGTALLLFEVVS